MDKSLIPEGHERTDFWKFFLWIVFWGAILLWGLFGAGLCFWKGLNQTNMDNRFVFALWIFLDLTVIALGAGAFFTGFLTYILKIKELKAVINAAVVVGFVCYSTAMATLAVDIGQPIRAWFIFWHANVHSMLTEVSFCISCYLLVLMIEYVPIILSNRQLKKIPSFLVFEFNLHKIMIVFAGIGTLLSFFHQGSLGGMFGVMFARPFAFREGFSIWPSTFFLFIISAIAAGPSFLLLVVWTASKVARKEVVSREILAKLGKISGSLMAVYMILKIGDTLLWLKRTLPAHGYAFGDFYQNEPFGPWVLVVELGILGLLPTAILLSRKCRENMGWLVTGAFLAYSGIAFNRFIMTIQSLAEPTLSFERYLHYMPSWQEWAVLAAVVAYGVLVFSLSFRYLPLFPQEKELGGSKA